MQRRILELVCKKTEARDIRGPAMAGRMEFADRYLQGIARLCAFDIDGARNRIDLAEIQVGERVECRVGSELSAGGIQAFEQDRFAGLGDEGRREILVPAKVMLGPVDGVVAGDAHDEPQVFSCVSSGAAPSIRRGQQGQLRYCFTKIAS